MIVDLKAMVLNGAAEIQTRPLQLKDVDMPEARQNEVLVSVEKCGVCRTDFHVVEGYFRFWCKQLSRVMR